MIANELGAWILTLMVLRKSEFERSKRTTYAFPTLSDATVWLACNATKEDRISLNYTAHPDEEK